MATYYYLDADNHQQGPLSEDALRSSVLTADLFVWTDGLDNWTRAKYVPALQPYLVGTPPPIPPLPKCEAAAPDCSPLSPDAAPTSSAPSSAVPEDADITPGEASTTPSEAPSSPEKKNFAPGSENFTPGKVQFTPSEVDFTPSKMNFTPGEKNSTPDSETASPDDALPPPPKTYFALSVVATALCCILGVFALLASTKVERLYAEGLYAAAKEKSDFARNMSIAAIILFAALAVLEVILIVAEISQGTVYIDSGYYY